MSWRKNALFPSSGELYEVLHIFPNLLRHFFPQPEKEYLSGSLVTVILITILGDAPALPELKIKTAVKNIFEEVPVFAILYLATASLVAIHGAYHIGTEQIPYYKAWFTVFVLHKNHNLDVE